MNVDMRQRGGGHGKGKKKNGIMRGGPPTQDEEEGISLLTVGLLVGLLGVGGFYMVSKN